MSTPITSPQGPKGEETTKEAGGGVKEAIDIRYQGWHHADDDFSASDVAHGHDNHIAIAGYAITAGSAGVARGYMRPTMFESLTAVSANTKHAAASTIEWLDDIDITATLVFRTANSTGVPAEAQDVNFTLTDGHGKTITDTATTDDAGVATLRVSDAGIVPGPVGTKWTVKAVHVPSSAAVWKAPDITTTFVVTPIEMGITVHHGGYGGRTSQIPANLRKTATQGKTAYPPTLPLFVGGDPWLWFELDALPAAKFAVMDQDGLINQVKLDIGAYADKVGSTAYNHIGKLSKAADPAGKGSSTSLKDANDWRRAHSGTGAGNIIRLGTDIPYTEAGIQGTRGIRVASDTGAGEIAFTLDPPTLGPLSNHSWRDLYKRGKANITYDGQAFLTIWATVKDDAPATRRWIGGAFTQNHRSEGTTPPFNPGWWQMSFYPVFFLGRAAAAHTVSGGTDTSTKHTHQNKAQVTYKYRSGTTTSARGARPGSYGYFGKYSGTWGNQSTTIHLSGTGAVAASVTGGTLRFQVAHTFLNAGADISIGFGGATPAARNEHVPKSGWVTIKLSRAQAQAVASRKVITIKPRGTDLAHYGYMVKNSVSVVLTQSG